MRVNHPYDGDLHMLIEKPREANREHLLFLRWLAERERLEHSIAGPPHPYPAQEWTMPGERSVSRLEAILRCGPCR